MTYYYIPNNGMRINKDIFSKNGFKKKKKYIVTKNTRKIENLYDKVENDY